MTEPKPPTDVLDEQEREFARVLRALPGGEPPAALDQKILRAAANAAASSRRPRSRWLASVGSLWGIGGAAAAVLALGVTWQMIDPTRPGNSERSTPVSAPASSEDSAVSVDFGQVADAPAGAAADATAPAQAPIAGPAVNPARAKPGLQMRGNAMEARPAPAAPMAAPGLVAAPPPPPEAAAQGGAAAPVADASTNAIDVASVESSTVLTNEQVAKLHADEESARARTEKATGELASAKPAQLEARAMTPAVWLGKVRKLRSEGRLDEARNSLELFHRYYPQFVIPGDLAPLLRE